MGFTTEQSMEDLSKVTEGGSYINESGVYFGEITLAEYTQAPSGAGFFTVSLKTSEDKVLAFAGTCAVKKDGTDSFGMAFYKTICKFTNSPLAEPVQNLKTGKMGFPSLYGKQIGLGVEVEFLPEFNAEGYQKTRKNIISVFDFATKKSLAETINNKGAIKCNDEIHNKGIKLDRQVAGHPFQTQQQVQKPLEDELPF